MLCVTPIKAFQLVLAVVAVVVLAFVPARCGRATEGAGVRGGMPEPGVAQAADPEARESARASGSDANAGNDPHEQAWEHRLERHEKHSRIAVYIFLGVVLLILLVWWARGKLYHRPRRL
jgi:hypothetical protein